MRRVPSTFSFVTQYYAYLASMVAVGYAWWRFRAPDDRARAWRAVLLAAILIAVFLSGARVAFLFVPLLVLVMLALDRQGRAVAPATVAGIGGAFLVAAMAIGTTAAGAVAQTFDVAKAEFRGVFVDGFAHAFGTTWLGLGTGTNTNATRYALTANSVGSADGYWYESWYVKVVLELGVPGLVLIALLVGTILVRGFEAHRALRDRTMRAVSAAMLAFLVINVVGGVKGQYVDFDPVNVYFWLFAGVLARLPFLDDRSLGLEAAR